MQTSKSTSSKQLSFISFVAFASSALLAGCGDGEPPRIAVAGKVSLDGKPLPTGKVTFVPLEGRTASVAEVRDGVFQADRSSGPAAGRYQVEIVAVERTGKKVPNPDSPGATIDEERDLVPERYNLKTELTAEVRPEGENAYEFLLVSQHAASKKRTRRR